MITDNMRLDAFLRHIRQDVPVLLFDLASKDNSKRLLMLRYEIAWVPVL